MNEIARRELQGGTPLLPVKRMDNLVITVEELLEIDRVVRDGRSPKLPATFDATMHQLAAWMQDATADHAIDCLTVLHGLYGARGDAEVVASVGVELIQAEEPCIAALYATTLAMLRPTPGQEAKDWNSWREIKPEARRFLPTPPELVMELRKQDELWRRREQILLTLPERIEWARSETKVRNQAIDDELPF